MQKKFDGPRKPAFKKDGDRRFDPRRGSGKPADTKKDFAPRKDGDKPFAPKKDFAPRQDGDKPFAPKKDFAPRRDGDRRFDPRRGGSKPAAPAGPKNSPARMAALKALFDVYFEDSFSNLALDKQLRATRMSDEDKRLATGIFYLCVENKLKIDYILSSFVSFKPEKIIECILHIACAQILFMDKIPPFAAVNEAVNQAKTYKMEEAAGFVNGVLRSLLRAKEDGSIRLLPEDADEMTKLTVEHSVSGEVARLLISAFGMDETKAILSYKLPERFETVRPNLLRWTDEELENYLTGKGIQWEKSIVPHCYRARRAGHLTETPEYEQGLYSLQGESAMLAALAVEAKKGMNILDACAAPGGKASLICEKMLCSGRVHAWDLHEHRVSLMKANGIRLGLDNLRCAERDATILKEDMVDAMDAVLIDAPCTGLGVIADKPDIKYNMTEAKAESIRDTQKKLLDTCCKYVRRGGLLVYSTCTILPSENEEQIRSFLLRHPEFRMETDAAYLPESLRDKGKDGMLTLRQDKDDLEGFFIARLRRV